MVNWWMYIGPSAPQTLVLVLRILVTFKKGGNERMYRQTSTEGSQTTTNRSLFSAYAQYFQRTDRGHNTKAYLVVLNGRYSSISHHSPSNAINDSMPKATTASSIYFPGYRRRVSWRMLSLPSGPTTTCIFSFCTLLVLAPVIRLYCTEKRFQDSNYYCVVHKFELDSRQN